ncbi:lysophospholipid acyltransferase family protein [Candidatus Venteria ishoeyi]|uniref:lysophospholipid acyltransferase family protein n=1 Tax=Candidatus Venteria ishoeyi TaxID=1899563 RepID=UPI0025A5D368|nr:lysophospholipid acyltransferase family protein [Candidatus Venteria ishoeyi]MDM8547862.1 lysophospholipid acyltransferase family protein [Candidatus Venteria ishoeyi]
MLLLKLLAWLPLPILYRLADIIYIFICYLTPYQKTLILDNLRNAFPEKETAELKRLQKIFYRHIADVLVESIRALRISEAELKRRVVFRNPEVLTPWLESQQSLLFMAAHQCNWEWLLLASCLNLRLPVDAIYKPLRYQPGDALMYALRARFGAKPIAVQDTLMHIMQRRKEQRAFALVADQSPPEQGEKYWTVFLNQETPFAVGADKIARLTRYPVFFVGMKRLKRGYYEVWFELLAEPPYAKTESSVVAPYIAKVQQQIQQAPEDWLWSYKKWKYKKPLYDNTNF